MQDRPRMRLTVLGARGSMMVGGKDFLTYGSSTSCYLVEVGSESVILDAGSGLLNAPSSFVRPPSILVSHLHIDHLLGLGMYGRLSQAGVKTRLYMPAQTAEEARQALARLYSPPLWPLELTAYAGSLDVAALPDSLTLGDIAITTAEGNHPGGCKAFRLDAHGRSIVYVTDYEYESTSFERLVAFSRGVDLLLVDAQYDEGELEAHRGFGHSAPSTGLRLLRMCGAGQLLLIHHDPTSTDDVLREREACLPCANARFAREGEVIEL